MNRKLLHPLYVEIHRHTLLCNTCLLDRYLKFYTELYYPFRDVDPIITIYVLKVARRMILKNHASSVRAPISIAALTEEIINEPLSDAFKGA